MFRMPLILTLALVSGVALAADDDFVMGNYAGAFTGDDTEDHTIRAQVAATSAIRYRAVIHVGFKGREEAAAEVRGKKGKASKEERAEKDEKKRKKLAVIEFDGKADFGEPHTDGWELAATIAKETFSGTLSQDGKSYPFELKRVFLEPPTRGQAPPEGAIVLMPQESTTLDAWHVAPHWKVFGDGSAGIVGSNMWSKEEFGDAQYHLEFKTSFKPMESGQARSNSGVYLMGRYEVQVLDSFADAPADNRCGGIYQKAVPVVNASLPPLQWQTYDITMRAPKFNTDDEKVRDAEITALHNGVLIHDSVILPDVTPGGLSGEEAPKGALMVQDHGDQQLRFRNVWVKPLNP